MRITRGALAAVCLVWFVTGQAGDLAAQRVSHAASGDAGGVHELPLNNGVQRHWLLGAGVGAAAGAIIGAVAASTDDNGDRQTLESGLIGAGVGLVVGGVIGYFITTEGEGGQAAIPVLAYHPGPGGGTGTIAWRLSY